MSQQYQIMASVLSFYPALNVWKLFALRPIPDGQQCDKWRIVKQTVVYGFRVLHINSVKTQLIVSHSAEQSYISHLSCNYGVHKQQNNTLPVQCTMYALCVKVKDITVSISHFDKGDV